MQICSTPRKVTQPRVLSDLSLDFTSLVVPLGDRRGEVSIGWNHDESNVSLQRALCTVTALHS